MDRLEDVVLDWLQVSGREDAAAVTGLGACGDPFILTVSWCAADGRPRSTDVAGEEMASLWRHVALAWQVACRAAARPPRQDPFDVPYAPMAELNETGQALLGEAGMSTFPAGGGDRYYGRGEDGVAVPDDW